MPSRQPTLPFGFDPTLSRAVWAAAQRRLVEEWRATPLSRLGPPRARPAGLSATPRDFRPTDPEAGRAILSGRFTLAGASMEVSGGGPWDAPSPSRRFAVELHRFSWLPNLLACGDGGGREALRLFLEWRDLFTASNPFAWSPETLERRVYNLACGARRLLTLASPSESTLLLRSLAGQADDLLTAPELRAREAERLAVCALTGTALQGATAQRLADKASARLSTALRDAVLPDGGHRSRSPEAGLELLYDLLTVDDVLLQRGREADSEITRAIDRLGGGLRFFTLGDGRLASFQGGGPSDPQRVRAAMAQDEGSGRTFGYAPHSGYHRLSGPTLQLIADAALPAAGPWSVAACAQPIAIEVAAGSDRLIANCGWSPDAAGPRAMRTTPAGCTATVGGASVGEILTGFMSGALGPRLIGGPRKVEARRNETETGLWLELGHDGWAERFGLLHERRFFLDPRADELRGEEGFTPVMGKGRVRPDATAFAVHFHIHPDVQVSRPGDRRSVLLKGPSGRGWWFRNDTLKIDLEPSVHFESGLPRKSLQVVLRGEVPPGVEPVRVRWKLTPAEAEAASGQAPA